jgi:hypothetical protein
MFVHWSALGTNQPQVSVFHQAFDLCSFVFPA